MNFKSILLSILVIASFNSCQKEEPEITTPIASSFFSNLEVRVIECEYIACANITSPSGIIITLFQTENDALENIDRIKDGVTDSEGKVFFTSLDAYDGVFVRVDYSTGEVYISYNSLGFDVTAYHEAIFVPGYSYDFNDVLERDQDHISFSLPLVGQRSIYQYHYNEFGDFQVTELDTISLMVTIEDRISDNLFLVSEKISSQPEDRFTLLPEETMMSYWEITQDSLIITPYNDLELKSCLFGLGYNYASNRMRFSVPLHPELEHKINFEDYDYYAEATFESNMYMEDVNILDTHYDLLYMNVINLQAGDSNLQLVIYNNEDGVTRYTGFHAWSPNPGLHWILVKE